MEAQTDSWHIRIMPRPVRHFGVTESAEPSPLDALAHWLTQNLRWLKQQIRRPNRSESDVEDLIQDAILRVAESCERQQVRDSAGVLVNTVKHLSMNDCRDRERHPYLPDDISEIDKFIPFVNPSPLPEDVVALEQGWKLINEVLQSVDPRTQRAFRLSRIEGMSYAEVGRQLGVSMSTIEKDIAWVMTLLIDAARERRR